MHLPNGQWTACLCKHLCFVLDSALSCAVHLFHQPGSWAPNIGVAISVVFQCSFSSFLVCAPCTAVSAVRVPLRLEPLTKAEVFTTHCKYNPRVLGEREHIVDPRHITNLLISLAGDGRWYPTLRTNWIDSFCHSVSFAWQGWASRRVWCKPGKFQIRSICCSRLLNAVHLQRRHSTDRLCLGKS